MLNINAVAYCSKELWLLQRVDDYSHSQNLPLKNYQEVRSPCVLYNFMRYQGIQLLTYFFNSVCLLKEKKSQYCLKDESLIAIAKYYTSAQSKVRSFISQIIAVNIYLLIKLESILSRGHRQTMKRYHSMTANTRCSQ